MEIVMCDWIASGENRIDPCLRETIKNLQKEGIVTLSSCCGHGKFPKTIVVRTVDGRTVEYFSGVEIPRKKRFYFRDCEGRLFIPEVDHYYSTIAKNERCLKKLSENPFYVYEVLMRFCTHKVETCAVCPFRHNFCWDGAWLLYADYRRGAFKNPEPSLNVFVAPCGKGMTTFEASLVAQVCV
jgi:hypothetical protein